MLQQKIRKFPETLESILVRECLGEEGARAAEQGNIPHALLKGPAAMLKALSESYTLRGPGGAPVKISGERARAYALYYTPINYVKVAHMIRTVSDHLPNRTQLRVLDYGCGPGTASLAAMYSLPVPVAVVATDSSPVMCQLAEKINRAAMTEHSSFRITSPDEALQGSYDIIFLAHVLNELSETEQAALIRRCVASLTDRGMVIIVDTALKDHTRVLMKQRDLLLSEDQTLTPLFPCTHRNACPMLAKLEGDWCHGFLSWEMPSIVRQLDILTGFNKHRIKLSAFVFQKNSALLSGFRIVTPPEKGKHGHSSVICGEGLFTTAVLPKNNRSDTNLEFSRADLFDRIEISDTSQLAKIGKDVHIIRHRF